MRRVLLILLTLVITTFLSAAGHAQAPGSAQQPPPTFKTDVNLVEVHVVVTDEGGNFVGNLAKDDFEIYEAGTLQKPSVFHLVDTPVAAPADAVGLAIDPDVREASQRFEGRLFVIVLDDLHTSALRSASVKRAARQFIERHLTEKDLAAVIHTSGRSDAAQELTPSRRLLLSAVDRFHGQKLPSLTAERLAVHLNDRDMERAAAGSEGDGSSSGSGNRQSATDDPRDGERGMNAQRALGTIKDVARWMADVPGRRKALVLFSEGIEYDIYDVFNNRYASSIMADAREAVAAAQRANVVVYAVDPRGLTQLGDEAIAIQSLSDDPHVDDGTSRGFNNELLMAQESLITLAQETGGFAIVRTNDLAGGLTRVERDTSRYYVLGYVSDPAKSPGRFRNIDVKVTKPGLKVRARRGYVPADLKAAGRLADVKPGTSPALAAALTNAVPVSDVPFRVWAAPFKAQGSKATVALAVEIEGSTLKYREDNGRFLEDLELSIIAADHNGKVRGSDRQTMNLKLKPETHRIMLSGGGVRLLSRIELPPARYQIRVGVHESNGGAVGSVPIDLEVPDYSKAPVSISGLVLTSTSAPRLVTMKPDPLLKDALPLPPVAIRSFTPTETVHLFAEVYARSAKTAHEVDVVVTVREAKRHGATVFNRRETIPVGSGRAVQINRHRSDLPLRDIKVGDYILSVEATPRNGGHRAVREVPFIVRASTSPLTH